MLMLGKDIIKHDLPTVTEEAENLVCGERRQQYGPAHTNFKRIAGMWTEFLAGRTIDYDNPISMEDVCSLMVLLKLARQAEGMKRDNVVDSIGYLRLIEIIREETRGERLHDGP